MCINAATMALVDAGIPVKDMVCACSATFIEETSMLGKMGLCFVFTVMYYQ